ncbi:hypothetical protein [Micromonospora rhizosphaerae]|uniref:hypothetical protein n=1 Tax=Micromonospora rhizosphaerae TaxID=568872 RepID=UPI000B85A0FA|nr:hypothetical protein [Micromonospora rhizosphaerae]
MWRSSAFPDGRGPPVIRDSLSLNFNNVTTTKQAVTSATGMIVMASKTTPIATGTPTCRWGRRERGHGWEQVLTCLPLAFRRS